MNEFVIVSDSTVDLPKEYLQSKQVPIISLSYIMDGVTYEEMDGLSHKEFFEKLRAGSLPTTSQINPEQAREALEPFAKEGKDILYIGFSSGLSGSYNSVRMAAEDLKEEYPDINIIAIDSLCACMGEGLLLYKALELKEHGMSMEEIAKWVEANKLHICHNVTVDDLNHLHRGGRISKTTAVVGCVSLRYVCLSSFESECRRHPIVVGVSVKVAAEAYARMLVAHRVPVGTVLLISP